MTIAGSPSAAPEGAPARTRRLFGNVLRLLAGKVATVAASFLLVRELIRVAGIDGYGMWAVCAHVVTWAAVLDLGLALGLQNAVSHREHRPEERAVLAGTISAVMLILAGVACGLAAIAAGLWWFAPGFVDPLFGPGAGSRPDIGLGRFFLSLVLAVIVIGLPLQVPIRVLAGLQEQGRSGVVQGLSALAGVLAFRPLVATTSLPTAMAVAVLLPVVGPALYAYIRLVRTGHGGLFAMRPDFARARDVLRSGLLLLVSQIAGVAVFQTDVLLVSIWHGPGASAGYEGCARLIGLGVMLQGILLAGLWPAVAQGWAQHDRSWVAAAYGRALRLSLGALVPLSILATCFAEPLFQLWTGERLAFDLRLLVGYVLFTISTLWAGVHATCLNAVGEVRIPALIAVVQAVVNLAVALVVVRWGAWTVAWASAGAALLVNAWTLWWYWRRRLENTAP